MAEAAIPENALRYRSLVEGSSGRSYIESSAEDLRFIYPQPSKLCDQLVQTWIEVLKFFGTPRVWRTADAFARRLK
jgi:hypothetical protein